MPNWLILRLGTRGTMDQSAVMASEDGDLMPLVETVQRWSSEADALRYPDAQREYLARVDAYCADGTPPPDSA